jgi:hypothetical protein
MGSAVCNWGIRMPLFVDCSHRSQRTTTSQTGSKTTEASVLAIFIDWSKHWNVANEERVQRQSLSACDMSAPPPFLPFSARMYEELVASCRSSPVSQSQVHLQPILRGLAAAERYHICCIQAGANVCDLCGSRVFSAIDLTCPTELGRGKRQRAVEGVLTGQCHRVATTRLSHSHEHQRVR